MQAFFATLSRLIRKPDAAGKDRIRIVSIVASTEDRSLVDGISTRCGWEVVFAETADQARHLSGQLNPAIILLDRDVAGGDWRHAVSSLSSSSAGTCVLLISKVADEYLWNEVVSYGGYDLIPKPLSEKDLCRAIKLAWSYWNGRRSATLVKK